MRKQEKEKSVANSTIITWLTNLHGRCPVCGSRRYREMQAILKNNNYHKECADCGATYN